MESISLPNSIVYYKIVVPKSPGYSQKNINKLDPNFYLILCSYITGKRRNFIGKRRNKAHLAGVLYPVNNCSRDANTFLFTMEKALDNANCGATLHQ